MVTTIGRSPNTQVHAGQGNTGRLGARYPSRLRGTAADVVRRPRSSNVFNEGLLDRSRTGQNAGSLALREPISIGDVILMFWKGRIGVLGRDATEPGRARGMVASNTEQARIAPVCTTGCGRLLAGPCPRRSRYSSSTRAPLGLPKGAGGRPHRLPLFLMPAIWGVSSLPPSRIAA